MYSFDIPETLTVGRINPDRSHQWYIIDGMQNYLFSQMNYSITKKLSVINTIFLINKEELTCIVYNINNPLGKPLFITKKLNKFSFDIHELVKDLPFLVNDLHFDFKPWKISSWYLTMLEKLPAIQFKSLINND